VTTAAFPMKIFQVSVTAQSVGEGAA